MTGPTRRFTDERDLVALDFARTLRADVLVKRIRRGTNFVYSVTVEGQETPLMAVKVTAKTGSIAAPRNDVDIAMRLKAYGLKVVEPYMSEVYVDRGYACTAWHWLQAEDTPLDIRDFARVLKSLRRVPTDGFPRLDPTKGVDRGIDRVHRMAADPQIPWVTRRIAADYEQEVRRAVDQLSLLIADEPKVFTHGSWRPDNLIVDVTQGPTPIDFEKSGVCSSKMDLMWIAYGVLRRSWPRKYWDAFVEELGNDILVTFDDMAPFTRIRDLKWIRTVLHAPSENNAFLPEVEKALSVLKDPQCDVGCILMPWTDGDMRADSVTLNPLNAKVINNSGREP